MILNCYNEIVRFLATWIKSHRAILRAIQGLVLRIEAVDCFRIQLKIDTRNVTVWKIIVCLCFLLYDNICYFVHLDPIILLNNLSFCYKIYSTFILLIWLVHHISIKPCCIIVNYITLYRVWYGFSNLVIKNWIKKEFLLKVWIVFSEIYPMQDILLQ